MKEELGVQVTDCRGGLFNGVHVSSCHRAFAFPALPPESRRAEMSRRTDVSILHVRRFTASDFAGDGTGTSAGDGEKVVLLL